MLKFILLFLATIAMSTVIVLITLFSLRALGMLEDFFPLASKNKTKDSSSEQLQQAAINLIFLGPTAGAQLVLDDLKGNKYLSHAFSRLSNLYDIAPKQQSGYWIGRVVQKPDIETEILISVDRREIKRKVVRTSALNYQHRDDRHWAIA